LLHGKIPATAGLYWPDPGQEGRLGSRQRLLCSGIVHHITTGQAPVSVAPLNQTPSAPCLASALRHPGHLMHADTMFVNVPSPGPVVGTFRAAGDEIQVVTTLEMSCEALSRRQLLLTNHTPGVVPGTNTSEWHPAADCVVALGRICVSPSTTRDAFRPRLSVRLRCCPSFYTGVQMTLYSDWSMERDQSATLGTSSSGPFELLVPTLVISADWQVPGLHCL